MANSLCPDEACTITEQELKYLRLLSKQYPNVQSASIEIINLQAILNLPKGTELFLSDLHGESESFTHMLKSASGVIRSKIDDTFSQTLSLHDRNFLATLIYYPEQKLELVKQAESNMQDWYRVTLFRLIQVARAVCAKYTRSKVRKALPQNFSYIMEELLNERNAQDKEEYYNQIVSSIIQIGQADDFIIELAQLIQRLAVDRLHIIGDIFDRGKGPDIILDTLMKLRSVDIQWGNHDILWMGAAAGSDVCIANVLRMASRYRTLDTLEEGYGINLLPLVTFAMDTYGDDPCTVFLPKSAEDDEQKDKETPLLAKIQKAITIVQLKLESSVIHRRFYEEMHDRLVLEQIDFAAGTYHVDGKDYPLRDTRFPTVNPADPCALTHEEAEMMTKLRTSFQRNEKLQRHRQFLYAKGSMYRVYNANLLYHGCIPLTEKGHFASVEIDGESYSGKSYIDKLERLISAAFVKNAAGQEKLTALDYLWYLWTGKNSPLYGKDKMATFERLFLEDKSLHREHKNPYYQYRDNEDTCNQILREFGLEPCESHIINGHVPVISKQGESPIKSNGRLLVIDGGLARPYHSVTGIAGYTLFYNSYGLLLTSHQPFVSIQNAIEREEDIVSFRTVLEKSDGRKRVSDTDIGRSLSEQIEQLQQLVNAYRLGLIKET